MKRVYFIIYTLDLCKSGRDLSLGLTLFGGRGYFLLVTRLGLWQQRWIIKDGGLVGKDFPEKLKQVIPRSSFGLGQGQEFGHVELDTNGGKFGRQNRKTQGIQVCRQGRFVGFQEHLDCHGQGFLLLDCPKLLIDLFKLLQNFDAVL